MVAEGWPPADQLWRQWVLLAAGHEALRRTGCRLLADSSGATLAELYDDGGRWLRMRRVGSDRAVVWGRDGKSALSGDLLADEAPDWAVDDDTAARWAADGVSTVAWFRHGEWTEVAACPSDAADLLAPALSYAGLQEWWSGAVPGVPAKVLSQALALPNTESLSDVLDPGAVQAALAVIRQAGRSRTQLSRATGVYLREEIYAQMRASSELGVRTAPKRPVLLRQWAKVNATSLPFRCAVYAESTPDGTTLAPADDNAGLGEPQSASLHNVLRELRADEAGEAGAWLFARVISDGRQVSMERAFDSWPGWFRTRIKPSLTSLAAEMERRTPRWRPPWAHLLPG